MSDVQAVIWARDAEDAAAQARWNMAVFRNETNPEATYRQLAHQWRVVDCFALNPKEKPMKELWITHTLFDSNADDGIAYYTSKSSLAEGVESDEAAGGTVQVYKCVPVRHEIYTAQVEIEITE